MTKVSSRRFIIMRSFPIFATCFVLAVASAGRAAEPPSPGKAKSTDKSPAEAKDKPVMSGIVFSYKTVDDRHLRLYVIRPDDWKETDRRPAIVFFHGGGWRGGTPAQFEQQSK